MEAAALSGNRDRSGQAPLPVETAHANGDQVFVCPDAASLVVRLSALENRVHELETLRDRAMSYAESVRPLVERIFGKIPAGFLS